MEAYKNQRMGMARTFLDQYRAEGDKLTFLKNIVTGDESQKPNN